MFSYYMPTKINFGRNCLSKLPDVVRLSGAQRILIFTGAKSAKTSGALEAVKGKLTGYKLIIFAGVKSNPSIESLKQGIRICRKENIDLIFSVGGGSVIDYGKAVSLSPKEKGQSVDKIMFIAVTTTFGTSSEITPYAVMTDEVKKIKVTLTDEYMFPDYAFTDPAFTLTMPRPLIATSCVDLFSHAVEAYWSKRATELTDNFAIQAIKLFLKYYRQTYQKPQELKIREKISSASIFTGLAFSNTRTTACHSISYPMTTVFNIPHGIACVLTLAELLEFNAKSSKEKILKLCEAMDCSGPEEARNRINSILDNLNIKIRLRDYGLLRKDLKIILDKGFTPERMKNNPRKVTKQDLKKILERIY